MWWPVNTSSPISIDSCATMPLPRPMRHRSPIDTAVSYASSCDGAIAGRERDVRPDDRVGADPHVPLAVERRDREADRSAPAERTELPRPPVIGADGADALRSRVRPLERLPARRPTRDTTSHPGSAPVTVASVCPHPPGDVRMRRCASAAHVGRLAGVVAVAASHSRSPGAAQVAARRDRRPARASTRRTARRVTASIGQGGVGPDLAGVVADKYPNIEDQIAVVTDGKGQMPSWRGDLTPKEIRKVVEYTRTGLGQ